MKSKKTTATAHDKENVRMSTRNLFEKENITWMIIGAAVMALGFILMAGGRSENPNVFEPDSVYSFRRITLAPIIILAGLVIEIYAIFRNPRVR